MAKSVVGEGPGLLASIGVHGQKRLAFRIPGVIVEAVFQQISVGVVAGAPQRVLICAGVVGRQPGNGTALGDVVEWIGYLFSQVMGISRPL